MTLVPPRGIDGHPTTTTPCVQVAILVGGKAQRMGGIPKGLLPHPSGRGSLVLHLRHLGDQLAADTFLAGNTAAYAETSLPMIPDAFPDIGPMGGIIAALQHTRCELLVVLACDLPFVPLELLTTILSKARLHPRAPAVMPERAERLEPASAVYRRDLALPSLLLAHQRGEHGLQRWARRSGCIAHRLPKRQWHWLDDWDTPQDIP